MINWIETGLTLQGRHIQLITLESDHIPILLQLATEKSIWQHYAIDGSDETKLRSSLEEALIEMQAGLQFPFVIYYKGNGKIIGSTRFLGLCPTQRKLEIGWTWLHPLYWGSIVNTECKYLLLTYCFERLKTIRVQLKTDVYNTRSQKAIEKMGGHFEGILRNDMIRDNGTLRDSKYYSIIQEEWPTVKTNLLQLLNR